MTVSVVHARLDELNVKLRRVRDWLTEQDAAGLLLRRRPNFAWITCGGLSHVNAAADLGAAVVLITPDRLALIANNIELDRLAVEQIGDLPFELHGFDWHDPNGQSRTIRQCVDGPLAADVSGHDIVADDAVLAMRASLTTTEIQRLRKLGALTTQIVEDVCRRLQPGWTEHRVAAEVTQAAACQEARVPVCLIAADQRIAQYRHPLPTDTVVVHRAMVVACIERHGLICSVTRLVNFTPLSDVLRRRHHAACHVDAAAVAATRVGRPLNDIFAEITAAYAHHGFADEWRHHHQGGSTGYQSRDTVASPAVATTVQPHQPFAWNPSIRGTKSEDTLLATPNGPDWITAPSTDWPTLTVQHDGLTMRRADILVRAFGSCA